MKPFLGIILLLSVLLTKAHAQQDADERYVAIYNLIQQADTLADTGQPRDALTVYTDAQARLQKFSKLFPSWDPSIVGFRQDDLEKKVARMKAQLQPKKVELPAGEGNEPAVKLQSQVGILESQLQIVQAENQNLHAKLKEALATQPAVIDAGELATAQEQIRSLLKQNELLKDTPGMRTGTDTNTVSQLRLQLDQSVKKLTDEHTRAQKLVEENSALQKNLTRTGVDFNSLELLRGENDRLKNQLTALQDAANNAAAAQELTAKLKDARSQIASLQSAATLASLEKAALENRVRKLSSQLTDVAANFDGRIRDLSTQRDDLLKKLASANASNSRRTSADVAAQLTALNNEVNVLRARIAVDESKPVEYSAQELALFKQSAPQVEPVRRSIKDMPAGTQNLVVSAQRHFSNHEFSEAEADYQKILDRDQNNGLALANLATIELQQDRFADAEKHIKAALVQSPEDAYNLSTLGYLKFRQEKFDDAFDALSHAVKVDPNNPETQNYLGVTLSHKGLRQQAETALRKALQLDPNYAPAHNNIAVIYLSQTPPSPQLARWHYQKALDAGQPHNTDLEKMLAEKGAPVEGASVPVEVR